ncbi:ATP-binding response regulator [Tautonia sociabilis]|uniref:histidine kinase n=1 Tax=Tautonia sociabilis TaxID=2080755 RepID=A0A432MPU0_9BACT|nr:response regulator [Tautonia sociabilis]RUL89350.1 hybrid sensor histidine kinase/response regulator [Tautonia sociabilis]
MSHVLIVDDSPADRAYFRNLLRRADFRVHEVDSGGQAVAAALSIRPHVVILDINLPDLDGHSVCRALRADPMIGGIPVLMLTVRDHEADVLAGLEAGADDYVPKDAAPEVVLARVRRLCRYRQMANTSLLNEQMAQIGRLLAGIVHEIRGPLGVIRGNAELMKMQLDPADPALRFAEPIIRSVQLLQIRLEHLMAAVRGGPPVLRPLEPEPLIREAVDYFRKGADPQHGRVEVTVEEPQGPLPPVMADAGRLLQVLLNLMINAREAILASRTSGRVVLRLSPCSLDDRPGSRIEVIDDGPGISEEVLHRIFEPFYTTKETGTGYGLYLSAEILREHGGRLWAENRPEGGARFCLWLPMATEAAPA